MKERIRVKVEKRKGVRGGNDQSYKKGEGRY